MMFSGNLSTAFIPSGTARWGKLGAAGVRRLRTCDHPSAVLVHGDPSRLALEDVIPAVTGGKKKRAGVETESVD